MYYRFNEDKNQILLDQRGFSFEHIIACIEAGGLKKVVRHTSTKYSHQYILHVYMNEYMYEVPCVREWTDTFFIKTAYPSRRLQKFYFPY